MPLMLVEGVRLVSFNRLLLLTAIFDFGFVSISIRDYRDNANTLRRLIRFPNKKQTKKSSWKKREQKAKTARLEPAISSGSTKEKNDKY